MRILLISNYYKLYKFRVMKMMVMIGIAGFVIVKARFIYVHAALVLFTKSVLI